MAASGPVPPSIGTLPPVGSPPRAGLDRRRVFAIVVVAGLVLTGLLGALVLLGGGPSVPPPTFFEARATVNGTVAGIGGGGWTLVLAVGVAERTGSAISVALVANRSGAGCAPSAVTGYSLPTSIAVPADSASFASGQAPLWVFVLRQSSTGPYLLADVVGSAGTPIAALTGGGCATNLSKIAPVPGHLVDSPTVAGKAWSGSVEVNASAFIAGDPAIDTMVMVATGTVTFDGYSFAGWGLEYAPCGPFQPPPLTNETAYVAAYGPGGTALAPGFTTETGCPTS